MLGSPDGAGINRGNDDNDPLRTPDAKPKKARKRIKAAVKAVISAANNRLSIMRMATAPASPQFFRTLLRPGHDPATPGTQANQEETTTTLSPKELVIMKRGAFKWLPVYFQNDLVHGSWWFVIGSVLCIVIPIILLISLFKEYLPTTETQAIPLYAHAIVYGILVLCGVCYTVGSFFMVRCFQDPPPPPYFSRRIISTDEVLAAWLFFWGTFPFCAICVIYVRFLPFSMTLWLAFAFCALASLICLLLVFACAPSDGDSSTNPLARQYLAPCLQRLLCMKRWQRHVQNDWLISCWLIKYFSALSTIVSLLMFAYSAYTDDRRGLFDWGTGGLDCLAFWIGSVYYVAGSYPYEQQQHYGGSVKTAAGGDRFDFVRGEEDGDDEEEEEGEGGADGDDNGDTHDHHSRHHRGHYNHNNNYYKGNDIEAAVTAVAAADNRSSQHIGDDGKDEFTVVNPAFRFPRDTSVLI